MDPLSRQKPGQCSPEAPGAGTSSSLASLPSAMSGQLRVDPYSQVSNISSGSSIQATAATTTEAIVSNELNATMTYITQYPIYLGEQLSSDSEKSNSSNQFGELASSGPFSSPSPFPLIEQFPLEALTDERWQLFLKILYSLTALTSFLLNIVTVIVLARSSGRSSGTTSQLRKYLINLSMSDLLMSMFSIPFGYTEYMLGEWIFSDFLCPVVKFVVTLSVFVSAATMTVIGINRYLAVIVYPFRCRGQGGLTVRQKHVIFAIWTVGIVIASPEWLTFKVEKFCHAGQYHVDCRQHGPDSFSQPYAVFIFLSTFFIPLVLMSYLYGCIGLKLWRRQLPGEAEANRDLTMQTQRLKVIKMLCVVVAVFAFFWLPLQTFSVVQFLYPAIREINEYQSSEYYIFVATFFVCHWLSMAHSCLNPLILYLMNEKFRSDLQSLILCKRGEHPHQLLQQQQQHQNHHQHQYLTGSWQETRLASCKAASVVAHPNCLQAQLLPLGRKRQSTMSSTGKSTEARGAEIQEAPPRAAAAHSTCDWAAISLPRSPSASPGSAAQLAPTNRGGATLRGSPQPTPTSDQNPSNLDGCSVAVAADKTGQQLGSHGLGLQPPNSSSSSSSSSSGSTCLNRPPTDRRPGGAEPEAAAAAAAASQADQSPSIEPNDDQILRRHFVGLVGSAARQPIVSCSGGQIQSLFVKVMSTSQQQQQQIGSGGGGSSSGKHSNPAHLK